MNEFDDIDKLAEQHRILREQMPHAWNPFFAAFPSLRPIQLAAMQPILSGANALVTAPTAGGKTEAVLAPLCERLSRFRWSGLSVLVVTPTRALVNDLYFRLLGPLSRMGISVGRKTSDHGLGDVITTQVLITTPESTDSLLMLRREELNSINAVVLDEIHLLDGSPRGDQLRGILSRLRAYRHSVGSPGRGGFQRIAMSATISNPRRLADCYLGEGAEIVSAAGQRELEAKIILAPGKEDFSAEMVIASADSFPDVHKILVFVNSRKHVDLGPASFKTGRFSKVPVYGHHGSLSKASREEAEERFKSDAQAICVATMTLEVGIDIGDIDLVICIDPPYSLSSFLQRIGRGCRRLNGRTRVLCVARDKASQLIFEALVKQAELGMPAGPTPPFRRSVLLQQVLAYLNQVQKHRRTLDQFIQIFTSPIEPAIEPALIEEIIQDMVQSGLLDKDQNVYQPASDGWNFIQSNRVFTNIQPNPLEVALVDVETGKQIASVAGVSGSSAGVRIAGRSYDLLPGGSNTKHRVRAGGQHEESPMYHAVKLPYAFDIGASLAARFEIAADTLAVIRTDDHYVVFTWLGRLLNAVLAHSLQRRGYRGKGDSFHLLLKVATDENLLDLLHKSVEDAIAINPLTNLPVDQLTSLGPHFKNLSSTMQRGACEDWLDHNYLRRWVSTIQKVVVVASNSELGQDLLTLTE